MGNADRRIGFVDVLAASAGGAESIDAQIRRIDHDLTDFIRFRHHRHRACRGVNAALGFGHRHALHAMAAGFEFQFRISAVADDARDDLAVTTEVRRAFRNDLHLPALALGVTRVHAEQFRRKQRGLVAAGTGTHFKKDVAFIIGIPR